MDKINPYLLLGISVIITVLYGILRNSFSKKHVATITDYYAFNLMASAVTLVVLVAVSGGIRFPSAFTILTGVLFGIVTVISAITTLQALNSGPFSYTMVIIYGSMIIPALSGRLIWGEAIGIWQYIGMILMLSSILFSVNNQKGEKKTSIKWLMYCITAFVTCGAVGVMQKIHQSSVHKTELNEFLIAAFLVSTLFSLVIYLIYSRLIREKKSFSFSVKSPAFLIAAVCGIGFALVNQFNLYLSGAMESAIFFPIVNGGSLILMEIVAIAFYREKLTRKQWVGMLIGIAAILLLCNAL